MEVLHPSQDSFACIEAVSLGIVEENWSGQRKPSTCDKQTRKPSHTRIWQEMLKPLAYVKAVGSQMVEHLEKTVDLQQVN